MKKIILIKLGIILLIHISINTVAAQQTRFNIRPTGRDGANLNGALTCSNIIPLANNEFITTGISIPSINNPLQRIGVSKIDPNGNLLSHYPLHLVDTMIQEQANTHSLVRLTDGKFIIAATGIQSCRNCFYGIIAKLDTDCRTVLWSKVYSGRDDPTITTQPQNVIVLPNGDLLMTGYVYYDSLQRGYVMRTDSLGNKLWEHEFSYTNRDYYITDTPTPTPDGGFLITAFDLFWNSSALDNAADNVIVKLDANGNEVWHKVFGGPYLDGSCQIQPLNNGTYLVATGEGMSFPVNLLADTRYHPYSKNRLIIMDENGVFLRDKYIGGNVDDRALDMVQLQNGDIVLITTKYDEWRIFISALVKINTNLDSIWYKEYPNIIQGLQTNESSRFWHITATPDGGMVLGGDYTGQGVLYPQGAQFAWLLKLDSDGCEEQNCLVGTSPLSSPKADFIKVFPNPADDILNIETKNSDVFLSYRIYDILGREVQTGTVTNAISTQKLQNGIYFLSINTVAADGTQSNAFLGGVGEGATKIIVQHP